MTNIWNPNINCSSIYNIFLINLNNIKLNYIFINYIFILYQHVSISLKLLILIFWTTWQTTKKCVTMSNFYYGYVKIHPPLQYIGSVYLFYTVVTQKKTHNLAMIDICVILIISFALGSLWALFQTVWGYYWSNDTIEYILLMFIVVSVITLHQYYILNYNLKLLLLIFTIFLLISLRLNLLYTKHNFFTKIEVLKYFSFFIQVLLVFNFNFLSKYKQVNIYLKKIILILIIIFIFFNKINNFSVKTIFSYFMTYFVLFTSSTIFKINNSKLIHLMSYLFVLIYNIYLIKYISSLSYMFINVKFRSHLFLFYKINNLKFKNNFQSLTYSAPINPLSSKNYNNITIKNYVIKKICNYF